MSVEERGEDASVMAADADDDVCASIDEEAEADSGSDLMSCDVASAG